MNLLDNVYTNSVTKIDFNSLTNSNPNLKSFLRYHQNTGTTSLDFKNDKALRALATALLQRDFNLSIELPTARLCPMIPGRLEYVIWILNLALSTSASPFDRSRPMIGLDIGTGSSAIYPLLAIRSLPSVSFVATEIDTLSSAYAARNIASNNMTTQIRLVRSEPEGKIFDDKIFLGIESIDFMMCNPPFYANEQEILDSRALKERDPHAVCTGSINEMITPGGEVAFVQTMIKESLERSKSIRWFSSLLGKYSSVAQIIKLLREYSIDNYAIKELTTGQTKRWIVAWSFRDSRLPDSLARFVPPSPQSTTAAREAYVKLLPLSNTHSRRIPTATTIERLHQSLVDILGSIDIVGIWSACDTGVETRVTTRVNSWSREARRKKGRGEVVVDLGNEEMECVIRMTKIDEGVMLTLEWIRGKDRIWFDSLASHLVQRILTTITASNENVTMELT